MGTKFSFLTNNKRNIIKLANTGSEKTRCLDEGARLLVAAPGFTDMCLRITYLILLLALIMLSGTAQADEKFVAATFSKAAGYVFSSDFVHRPVDATFNEEELAVLEKYKTELSLMIHEALGVSNSVGGALLAAHFGLSEHVPYLRSHLLHPGTPYGWEGPDYSDEEALLTDYQFVYHSVYLNAIEAATGQTIYEAIQLTDKEIQNLFQVLNNPSNRQYYWAKWLLRKFQLLPEK